MSQMKALRRSCRISIAESQEQSWDSFNSAVHKFFPKAREALKRGLKTIDFFSIDWGNFAIGGNYIYLSPDLGSNNIAEYKKFLDRFAIAVLFGLGLSPDDSPIAFNTLKFAHPTFCFMSVNNPDSPEFSFVYPPQNDFNSVYRVVTLNKVGEIRIDDLQTLKDIRGVETAVYYQSRETVKCDDAFLSFISQI